VTKPSDSRIFDTMCEAEHAGHYFRVVRPGDGLRHSNLQQPQRDSNPCRHLERAGSFVHRVASCDVLQGQVVGTVQQVW
jgi:hypothetical protein